MKAERKTPPHERGGVWDLSLGFERGFAQGADACRGHRWQQLRRGVR